MVFSSYIRDPLHAMQEASVAGTSFVIGVLSTIGLDVVGWLPLVTGACLLSVFVISQRQLSLLSVAVVALSLGLVCGLGGYIYISHDAPLCYVGVYMSSLTFFHLSEYFTTALFNRQRLSPDSFLLNHSKEYIVAALCSWIEYAVEYAFFPYAKSWLWLSRLGIVMVIVGECLRKVAMFTSRSNFSHLIAYKKAKDHELVTHGVYNWFRHPSYVGWFYWSIGTQLLLSNPICLIGYTMATWRFFRDRVEEEEMTLLAFFGSQYFEYQQRVGTGLPLVRGYVPTERERMSFYKQ